jgi:phospholipid/cholesterol/gamma-HCH transport system substrate-binding protein
MSMEPTNPSPADAPGGTPFLPRSMGVKVGMLLAISLVVAVALLGYVLYARGVFEDYQRLTLVADNVEGVSAGMDVTFAGFPIGRVRRLSLADDGKARIHIRVPVEQARWLRTTTVFTLEVPLVGSARIRAYTGNLQDPPLPDRAERPVLRGDASEEIPRMVASARAVLENMNDMTERGSSLQESLRNARTVTERMAGKFGVLGGVLGGEEHARKVVLTLDRANALLASMDGLVAKADQRVLGPGGIADETQKAIAQANAILGDVRASLKRVDGILADAQAVAGNAKAATADLAALRAEVDASLRKVGALIDELNRKWPFERDTKIRLP